jgi:chromosome segregation ATPase
MKKKITIALITALVLSLLTGTVAYAKDFGQRMDNLNAKIQKLQELKPLSDEMRANRTELKDLKTELRQQSQAARAHIKDLKAKPESVTSEQIEQIKSVVAEIKKTRAELKDANGQFKNDREDLKSARKNKDTEGVKAAFQKIIDLQEQRIARIKTLIELNKKLSLI